MINTGINGTRNRFSIMSVWFLETWQLDVCSCCVQADEGFKFEVMQVVSLQIKDCQTVERSQSIAVDLRDVVVTQLEHLDRQAGHETARYNHSDFNSYRQTVPLVQAACPGFLAAQPSVCCSAGTAVWAWRGPWTHRDQPSLTGYSWGPASPCCPDTPSWQKHTEVNVWWHTGGHMHSSVHVVLKIALLLLRGEIVIDHSLLLASLPLCFNLWPMPPDQGTAKFLSWIILSAKYHFIFTHIDYWSLLIDLVNVHPSPQLIGFSLQDVWVHGETLS